VKQCAIKAVYMSGYSERHAEERGFDTNIPLLTKPFTVHDLLRAIERALAADR
jgi:hypothetical protein